MLTPAEELGLSGMRLASRVRRALYRIPEPRLVELLGRMHDAATMRRLVYVREDVVETVRVLPCPIPALAEQLSYVHSVTFALQNAHKRLAEAYMKDPAVHDVLRLTPEEDEWLRHCWGPSVHENSPMFGRLDAVVDFTSAHWKDSLIFLEPNLSGIGGLHMVPTTERVLFDHMVPVLHEHDPELRLETGADARELLLQEVMDHLQAIGRRGETLCFVEPKYEGNGPDEQEQLVRWARDRHGMRVLHADPAELVLRGEEVYYQDTRVDLVYRDYAVLDLLDLKEEGVDVSAMRELLRQNRMISSIAAELDQKSCFEVFTDPVLAERHFTAEERRLFRRHVPWTRVLSARRTVLPDGTEGDLVEHVRRHHESLVLKPNRAYGGEGVVVGPAVTEGEWERAVEGAMADEEDRWVVQRLARLPVHEFPLLGPDGRLHVEPFYVVMGFAPSAYGVSVLVRGSQKQVVNVAQRGGLCAVLVGHPVPGAAFAPPRSSPR